MGYHGLHIGFHLFDYVGKGFDLLLEKVFLVLLLVRKKPHATRFCLALHHGIVVARHEISLHLHDAVAEPLSVTFSREVVRPL